MDEQGLNKFPRPTLPGFFTVILATHFQIRRRRLAMKGIKKREKEEDGSEEKDPEQIVAPIQ